MNADQLLVHYEQVADAPDAISHLRRFILDLAVRGKLMEQNANDEPTSELLKRIEVERKERVARGEIKRAKPLNSITRAPFDPPSDWTWLPLGETGNIFTGNSINAATREQLEKTVEGRPFIATKDVGYGFDEIDYTNGLLVELSDERFKIARSDSVLICAEGGSAGRKIALTDREISFGNKLLANETWGVISPKFVLCVYLSDFFYAQFAEKMTGVIGGISLRNFLQLPFPLPPLAEQHRIVAKVDELMTLCDQLEAARAEREATRDRLTAASLVRLDSPDPHPATFRVHAAFALENLSPLTARSDQIKVQRQTILNLAVRGKLVEQDPTDEPASGLLEAINKTRKKLYAEKKIPKPKPLLSLDELDLPFDVPPGWAWSMLGQLCYQVADGPHFSPQYVRPGNGVPFLSTRNVRPDGFDLSSIKYVSQPDHEEFCKRIKPEPNDIIYTKGGTTGIAKVNDLDFEFSVWVHLAVLRIEKERLFPHYVELALNSPHCYAQSQEYTRGISNFDLGLTRMIKITVPIPPLAEQHRIVARVDELMALCDRLETALTTVDTTRARLLEALLHEALGPAEEREVAA